MNRESAIPIQQRLIHGLSRSPIRADFHNTLVKLSLFLSINPGIMEWAYVLVQMKRRMTRRRDWRLNIAVILRCVKGYLVQCR